MSETSTSSSTSLKNKHLSTSFSTDMFKIDDYHFPSLTLLCGKSGRGKSHTIKYLIQRFVAKKKFSFGVVFSGSKDNDDYKFIDERHVYSYSEEAFENYVKWLESLKASKKDAMPSSFLILDDLLGKLNDSPIVNSFMSRFRHLNVSIFLACQYLKTRTSSTLIREQTNYAFIFNTKTKNTIQPLFEYFGGLFDDYDSFKAHFLASTDLQKFPHTSMLYIEAEDELDKNYLQFTAPASLPDTK